MSRLGNIPEWKMREALRELKEARGEKEPGTIPPPKPGELDDYMTGEGKSWVAGEDPVPPLPEDTGGVIQEDGSKVWGTLPTSKPSPVKPSVTDVLIPSETPDTSKTEAPWTTPSSVLDFSSFERTHAIPPGTRREVTRTVWDVFDEERLKEEQAFTTPFMLGLETEEEKARRQYKEQLLFEESRARLDFITQLEEFAPSEYESLSGSQLLLMTPKEREEYRKELARRRVGEDPLEYEYTETQEKLFGKEIKQFESGVKTWKTEQQEVFEENVEEWRRGEESRLEEYVQEWRTTWRPKGLAERLFEQPIKENPIFRLIGGAKALEQLSGVVATGESFAYGLGRLVGIPTLRSPPTVTGGMISTIAGSVKIEPSGDIASPYTGGRTAPRHTVKVDPTLSPEMEAISIKGSEYAFGSIVGEIGLALGLGYVGGKVSSKVIAPMWKGSRPEKFLIKHSDWYYKRYGSNFAPDTVFHAVPTDPDIPLGLKHLQGEDFMWDQLMSGSELGRKGLKARKLGRTSAVGIPGGSPVLFASTRAPLFAPVSTYTSYQVLTTSADPMVSTTEDFAGAFRNLLKSQRGGAPMVSLAMAPQRVGKLMHAPVSGVSRAVTRDPFGVTSLLLRGGLPGYQDPTVLPRVEPKTPQVTHPEVPTVPFLGMDLTTRTDLEEDLDVAPVIHTGLTDIQDKINITPLVAPVVSLDPLTTPYVTPDVPTLTKQRTDLISITLLKQIQTPRLTFGYPQFDITPLVPPGIPFPEEKRRRRPRKTKKIEMYPLLWDLQELRYPVAGEGEMLNYVLGNKRKRKRKK